jgi:hypothetical protein
MGCEICWATVRPKYWSQGSLQDVDAKEKITWPRKDLQWYNISYKYNFLNLDLVYDGHRTLWRYFDGQDINFYEKDNSFEKSKITKTKETTHQSIWTTDIEAFHDSHEIRERRSKWLGYFMYRQHWCTTSTTHVHIILFAGSIMDGGLCTEWNNIQHCKQEFYTFMNCLYT